MAMKWRRVRNKQEWVCDLCRKCADEDCRSCGTEIAKWFKRLDLTTNAERDALNEAVWGENAGVYQGTTLSDYGDEFCLCDSCFDEWREKAETAIKNKLMEKR